MKIVHIGFFVVTDGLTYQDNLLPKYHVRLGHKVWYITGKWILGGDGKITQNSESRYTNNDGVHMIRLDEKRGRSSAAKFKKFVGLYSELKDIKPEVLFVHGCQFLDISEIVKYVKNYPETVVYVDNHADLINSATNLLSKYVLHRIIWRHYAQKIFPYTRKFYGVLPARVQFLKEQYRIPEEKIDLLVMGADDDLVNGVKSESIRKEFRSQHRIEDDDFLIVTGGKIDSLKRQTLLLMQAINKINRPDVKLIVFGPVDFSLKEEFDMLMSDRMIYIKWLSAEESYKCFASSNLVIFPGSHSVYWEQVVGLGIMYFYKYWKGADHVDVGGNCQFLYSDSVEEIFQIIIDLINNPKKLDSMRQVAEERGMDTFSYYEIARRSLS